MPTQVMGSAYLAALEAYPMLYEPEADELWKRRDVEPLAQAILGRMFLGVELDDLGGYDIATGEGGKYVEVRTRIGTVFGSGYNWPLALAQALAAYAELVKRAKLTIKPISQKEAFAFIDMVHAHHEAPRGDKFRLGAFSTVNDFDTLVGVGVVGRPRSRILQDRGGFEVTRVAVLEGGANLCSALYTACWKEAQRRGMHWLFTYILHTESGASLKAAGWHLVAEVKGGTSDRPSRRRVDKSPTCDKQRWEPPPAKGKPPAASEEVVSLEAFFASKAREARAALHRASNAAKA